MFSIPTITTSLSGFGLWVKEYCKDHGNGIAVIERTDDNEKSVVSDIRDFIRKYLSLSEGEIREARFRAHEISRIAMWDNLVKYYFEAYKIALEQSSIRREEPGNSLSLLRLRAERYGNLTRYLSGRIFTYRAMFPTSCHRSRNWPTISGGRGTRKLNLSSGEWIPHSGKRFSITPNCFLKR